MIALRYTRVAVTLHWLIALVIAGNLALGFTAAWSEGAVHRVALDMHEPIGITILALGIARATCR